MNSYYNNDPQKMLDDFQDMLWDDPKTALAMGLGHSEIHMIENESLESMVSRLLEEQVRGVGSFVGDEEEIVENIANAAMFKAKAITKWATSSRADFDRPDEYKTLAFTVFMGEDEITGVGLEENNEHKLEKKLSRSIRMVLSRDKDCMFGFYLKTAYPNIHDEYAETTGEFYDKEAILQKHLYKFTDRMSLASFISDNTNIRSYYRTDSSHEPYLYVRDNRTEYVAYIKEYDTKFYRIAQSPDGTSKKEKQKVSREEVESNAPDFMEDIKKMEKTIRQAKSLKVGDKVVPIDSIIRKPSEDSEFEQAVKKKLRRQAVGFEPSEKGAQEDTLSMTPHNFHI